MLGADRVRQPASLGVPATQLWLHPLTVACLVALVVNDRWLKGAHPGVVSGKLSDLAGLHLLTLLITGALALPRRWRGGAAGITLRDAAVAALICGIGFAAVKSSAAVAHLYGDVVGWLRAPWADGSRRVGIVLDPSDLLVLPVVAGPWWLVRRAQRAQPVRPRSG